MLVDKLETHDRMLEIQKKSDEISGVIQDAVGWGRELFQRNPFYVFGHERTVDGVKYCMWQIRLSKPTLSDNSMLFRCDPSGEIRTIWILPPKYRWNEYSKGKMLQSQVVTESIHDYNHDKERLERKEEGDLSDISITYLYAELEKEGFSKANFTMKSVIGLF